MLNRINLNYIIAVPLIVMSYHIYNFYETEPIPVRIALAASFDLMVVVCFYLLKDPLISKRKNSIKATWLVLLILIAFQLYVNVWAYWELHPIRAFLSGSIFPITVALISYISMMREQQFEKTEARKVSKVSQKPAEISTTEQSKPLTRSTPPWKGKSVTKQDVINAFKSDPTDGKDLFKGAKNMRSVYRWWTKLEAGETP